MTELRRRQNNVLIEELLAACHLGLPTFQRAGRVGGGLLMRASEMASFVLCFYRKLGFTDSVDTCLFSHLLVWRLLVTDSGPPAYVFSAQSYNSTALCSQTQIEERGYSIALLGAYVCVGIDNRVGLTK